MKYLYCIRHVALVLALALLPSAHADEVILQLKWFHQYQAAGFYAADIQGYYAEEGIDVVIREGGPGVDSIAQVTSGEVDFGISGADLLAARLAGQPVVAVAPIFQHSAYILLSLPDHPVRKPEDLRGLRWDPLESTCRHASLSIL